MKTTATIVLILLTTFASAQYPSYPFSGVDSAGVEQSKGCCGYILILEDTKTICILYNKSKEDLMLTYTEKVKSKYKINQGSSICIFSDRIEYNRLCCTIIYYLTLH